MNEHPNAEGPALPAPPAGVLVLGIGNLLWADEGFGVRASRPCTSATTCRTSVSLVDGGTQGLYLLDHVCSAERVLVFDAIDYGLRAGHAARVARRRGAGLGRHEDEPAPDHLPGTAVAGPAARPLPERITLIGVQPDVLDDFGGSLSPRVRARLDEAVALAVDELAAWGFERSAAHARRPRAAERRRARPARYEGRAPVRRPRPAASATRGS